MRMVGTQDGGKLSCGNAQFRNRGIGGMKVRKVIKMIVIVTGRNNGSHWQRSSDTFGTTTTGGRRLSRAVTGQKSGTQ